MKVNVKGLAVVGAVMCGGALLLVGLVNLAAPSYGTALLDLFASIYPGYHGPGNGLLDVIVGTVYGSVDGAIGGAIVAWVYNTASVAGHPAPM